MKAPHAINIKNKEFKKELKQTYEDFEIDKAKTWEEWEEERENERKTFKGKMKYACKDYLYWPIRRVFIKVGDIPSKLKSYHQRGTRGWANSDAWDIDAYLGSFMPELLRHMIDEEKGGGNSYPGVAGDKNADTHKHWQKTVETIAKGFEAGRKQDDIEYKNIKDYWKEYKKLERVRKKGMILFMEYYNHLWD